MNSHQEIKKKYRNHCTEIYVEAWWTFILHCLKLWLAREKRKNKIKYKKEKYWVYCPSIFYAFLFYFLFEHLWWCGRLKWILPFSGIKAWRLPKSQSCYTIPVSLKCTALDSVVIFFFHLLTHWAFCQDILKADKEKLELAWYLLPS